MTWPRGSLYSFVTVATAATTVCAAAAAATTITTTTTTITITTTSNHYYYILPLLLLRRSHRTVRDDYEPSVCVCVCVEWYGERAPPPKTGDGRARRCVRERLVNSFLMTCQTGCFYNRTASERRRRRLGI